MNKWSFILRGAIFGAVISSFITFIFMLVAQVLAGGFTSLWGESWLYVASLLPFIITFSYLGGYFFKRTYINEKQLWKISFISAFFIILYSGTVGALFGEMVVRGEFETINVSATLGWGVIYTFILTPCFTPIARLLISIFTELILKLDAYTE